MTAPASRRFLPGIRWWHKWVGIGIGVLLFGWTASGIIMMFPQTDVAKGVGITVPSIDWTVVAITPAEAARVADSIRPATPNANTRPARSIVLQMLLGTPVYSVTPIRGQPVLVNAVTGGHFQVNEERAALIASQTLGGRKPVSVERITKAPAGYWGKLPAFQLSFDDAGETIAIVAESTGELERTQRRDRYLSSIGHRFHVFGPLAELPGGQNTRKGTLIITGMVGLLSIVTGYWLSLPKRWFKRPR